MVNVGRNLVDYPESRSQLLRKLVLDAFEEQNVGYTADQVAEKIYEDKLSIRPRVSELYSEGLVFDTGERGRNRSGKKAIIWKAFIWWDYS